MGAAPAWGAKLRNFKRNYVFYNVSFASIFGPKWSLWFLSSNVLCICFNVPKKRKSSVTIWFKRTGREVAHSNLHNLTNVTMHWKNLCHSFHPSADHTAGSSVQPGAVCALPGGDHCGHNGHTGTHCLSFQKAEFVGVPIWHIALILQWLICLAGTWSTIGFWFKCIENCLFCSDYIFI